MSFCSSGPLSITRNTPPATRLGVRQGEDHTSVPRNQRCKNLARAGLKTADYGSSQLAWFVLSCGSESFARLRALQPGDQITVERQDGTTAAFTVVKGEQYAKDNFPTDKVYGNTPGPELRLITCDGLDRATGLWQDNYVVYAVLSDLQ